MPKFQSVLSKDDAKLVTDLIDEYIIPISNLRILIEDNKFIAGVIGDNLKKETIEHFKYNHFIESINDLANKTRYSIEKCVKGYLKLDIKKYNPVSNKLSSKEQSIYYFMENALFREIVLWDSLAQLYNIYFDLKIDIRKVCYKDLIKKLKNNAEIDFKSLISYIEEPFSLKNDIDVGVHSYVNNLRNQMTHRYSIAITSFSNDYNLRAMPDAIYRIAKDYNEVTKRLCEIINLIIKRIYDNDIAELIYL